MAKFAIEPSRTRMRKILLNNVTANGSKAEIFKLKEIQCSGKYGNEFNITYQRLACLNKYFFGKVCMIDGR